METEMVSETLGFYRLVARELNEISRRESCKSYIPASAQFVFFVAYCINYDISKGFSWRVVLNCRFHRFRIRLFSLIILTDYIIFSISIIVLAFYLKKIFKRKESFNQSSTSD
jgi:hypothetical protein